MIKELLELLGAAAAAETDCPSLGTSPEEVNFNEGVCFNTFGLFRGDVC
jgi:hypothetical protein